MTFTNSMQHAGIKETAGPNLSTAIQEYFDFQYHLEAKTREIYGKHLKRLADYLHDPPLSQITHRDLARFMGSLKKADGSTYAPNYRHQVWRALHTFFEFWFVEEAIPANPMRRVPKPKIQTGPKPHLNEGQVKQILDELKNTSLHQRNRAIILLMVDSGLRVGEVIKLTAADLFLDEGYCYVEDKKNLKRRQVPLSEAGQAALRAYLDDRPLTGDPAHIFRKRCGRPITYESIRLLIRRLEERLEIKLNPHLFRHTFATLYLKDGGNMKYLQQILGHSSIDTTSRFYTHPEWADIKAEYDRAAPSKQLA